MTINSAVYAFVDDLVDEGTSSTAKRLAEQGFSAVALAAVYHAARDLLPHNPHHVVAHRTEGAHYFRPDNALYSDDLSPATAALPQLPEVAAEANAQGLSWQAWTVYLHNGRLATARPDCAVTNAFGDVYETDLCPASTEVAGYAAALTADVARLRPALIVAESLHHAGFSHGAHHERAFVPVSAVADFLLSLCFCAACRARASRANLDPADLATRVRNVVRRELHAPSPEQGVQHSALAAQCGPDLLDYLRLRESMVTELATQCAAIAHAQDVPFGFLDQTGALKGYVTGEPIGPSSCDDAWRLGINVRAVANVVDTYVALAYAKSAERVALDVRDYVGVLAETPLRCVLRHGGPDFTTAAALRDKVRAAHDAGAQAVDFYHYGLMPLSGLEAASAAIKV